jgi:hypothetical protein
VGFAASPHQFLTQQSRQFSTTYFVNDRHDPITSLSLLGRQQKTGNGWKTSRSGNAELEESTDIAHVPIDFRAFSDGTLLTSA